MKLQFYFDDLVLFYKILYSLVSIKLPKEFTIVKGNEVRYTGNTAAIINEQDITQVKCPNKPYCDSYKNCFYYRIMLAWNKVPCNVRRSQNISSF